MKTEDSRGTFLQIFKLSLGHGAVFVAGAAAPKGRKLGHAGAIVNSGAETAEAKKEALKSAGVTVADTITTIGEAMIKAMEI